MGPGLGAALARRFSDAGLAAAVAIGERLIARNSFWSVARRFGNSVDLRFDTAGALDLSASSALALISRG